MAKDTDEMGDREIRSRILKLAFQNNEEMLKEFTEKLLSGLPSGTGIALRGSVVTNEKYKDSRPFDADGEGTSDLDVTLIGHKVMEYWDKDGFYIPRLHTKPLGDLDPAVAAVLNPLRMQLQEMMKRPVNFQATANLILFARDILFDQPYFILVEADPTA